MHQGKYSFSWAGLLPRFNPMPLTHRCVPGPGSGEVVMGKEGCSCWHLPACIGDHSACPHYMTPDSHQTRTPHFGALGAGVRPGGELTVKHPLMGRQRPRTDG